MKNSITHNSQSGFSKFLLFAIIFGFLVISGALFYILSWRPVDTEYQKASADIATLKENSRKLRQGLASIEYYGDFRSTVATNANKLTSNYKKALESLDSNIVFKHDLTSKNTYEHNKVRLANFEQSSTTLSTSLGLYTAILDSCTDFTNSINKNDTEKYDDLLTGCQKALENAKSSPNETFNDQFFTEYRDQTTVYINAVKNFDAIDKTVAAKAKITMDQAYAKIIALGSKKIEYSLPDPSNALNTLSSTIDSQKKAVFR